MNAYFLRKQMWSFFLMLLIILIWMQISFAAAVYIKNYSDFPAYPYNTSSYKQNNRYVGCGPTTGAMMFGYFDHIYSLSPGLLTSPVSGVNEGLQTAWALHGSQYMNTGADGFGSVYNIEPGMENYALSRGYYVKVMIHVSPTYNNPTAPEADWLNDYGPYGESWNNDGTFWIKNADGTYNIDATKFCDFVDPKLAAGVPIFLTIDTNYDKNGDHWVALVGYDRSTLRYYFYDTYSTTIKSAEIHYCAAPGTAKANAISFLRSVSYIGPVQTQENPPRDLLALTGYHSAVPLAWKAPQGTAMHSLSRIAQYQEVHADVQPIRQSLSLSASEQIPGSVLMSPSNPSLMKETAAAQPSLSMAAPTGYNVYRSTSSGGSYSKIAGNVTRQYYRDATAVNGTKYYYKVTAVYTTGESDFSAVVSATPTLNGYVINSAWTTTTPTLNGVISTGEWSAATQVNILYPGDTGTVTAYIMNTSNKLYMAVDDKRDTHLDNVDQFAIFFDKNLNREWPAQGGSTDEGNFWWAWDATGGQAFCLFGPRQGYWPDHLYWPNRTTPAGMNQGISIASGNVQYEGVIDLTQQPLNVSAGAEIGLLLFTFDYTPEDFTSFWPQQAERLKLIVPDFQYWGQAPFSFGNLKLSTGVVTAPDISVTPSNWNYGQITVGGYQDKTFVVKNEGNANLVVSSINLAGDISQFSLQSGAGSYTLTPGQTRNVVIRFQPTSVGAKNLTARIASNDPDENPFDFTLTGQGGAAPVLSVNPTTLNFGTTTNSLTFQISNTGGGTLTWNVAESPDKAWMSLSPTSGSNAATVTVNVNRAQLAGNSDTGTLAVTSNGGNQNVTVNIAKTAASLPSHWNFASNTGNSATIVLPTSANPNIDGTPLANGDYIGVFNPSGLCCGHRQWQGANMSITAWGDNDQTGGVIDGFQAGEDIHYRVYRLSEAKEWTIVMTGYSQGTGKYSANGFMVLDKFDVTEQLCNTLNLLLGWNMFSLNIIPQDADISAVMAPISSKIIIAKSGEGKTYIPAYGINDIAAIKPTKGYQIYMKDPATLEVCGIPIDVSTVITLPVGWSMISYLPRSPMSASLALAGIQAQLVIAKNNNGQAYIPAYGINDIGLMQPGQGYQLYLKAAANLIYPAGAAVKERAESAHPVEPQHFHFKRLTGCNCTVIVPSDIQPRYSNGLKLTFGDEIGVFSIDGACRGAIVWQGRAAAITIWGDNSQTSSKDGCLTGDELQFRVWNKDDNQEYPALSQSAPGESVIFQPDGIIVLNGLVADLTADGGIQSLAPEGYALMQNYPNPFNPETWITYRIAERSKVRLEVLDLKGCHVRTLIDGLKAAGQHRARWNGLSETGAKVPSGLYIYRLETEAFVTSRKMLLMR
ncbi:choice-of-anchor D domain-containing protein [candidate division KSB1 bacterium]|nr:choice-of-anchor D domain-containing protein [candidate division KSB1 bacterium]